MSSRKRAEMSRARAAAGRSIKSAAAGKHVNAIFVMPVLVFATSKQFSSKGIVTKPGATATPELALKILPDKRMQNLYSLLLQHLATL